MGDGKEKKDVTGRVKRKAGSHVRTADSRDEDESDERKRNRAKREDNEVSQQLNETVPVSSPKKKRTRTPASGGSVQRSIGPITSLLAISALIFFFQRPGVPLTSTESTQSHRLAIGNSWRESPPRQPYTSTDLTLDPLICAFRNAGRIANPPLMRAPRLTKLNSAIVRLFRVTPIRPRRPLLSSERVGSIVDPFTPLVQFIGC